MNSTATSPARAAEAPGSPEKPDKPGKKTGPSAAEREVAMTTWLVVGALLIGLVAQVFVPPGAWTLVGAAFLASLVVVGAGYLAPGHLRQTLSGFRFIATLLFVLAVEAILGTLILQLKPAQFYLARYGGIGKLIVALRLDDIFHGLPFALLMALFGASVIASALLRWPVKVKNLGFFIAHVGIMVSLAGAGASATLSIRGRIDLFAGGETATKVRVTKAGQPTGEAAALGFDLRLDRFEAPSYESEYRVGYYEQTEVRDEHGVHMQWRLKASFEPDLERHRLPSGDSFQLTGVYPDFRPVPDPKTQQVAYGTASQEWRNPAVAIRVHAGGLPKDQFMMASRPQPAFLSPTRALLFEKRGEEKRAYISHVTAIQGTEQRKEIISVNEPMTHNGWTLYQVNYNPEDPTYSGLDAVYDPGVSWVFLGFALICLGVFYMFYVEPRLKGRAPGAAKA